MFDTGFLIVTAISTIVFFGITQSFPQAMIFMVGFLFGHALFYWATNRK